MSLDVVATLLSVMAMITATIAIVAARLTIARLVRLTTELRRARMLLAFSPDEEVKS